MANLSNISTAVTGILNATMNNSLMTPVNSSKATPTLLTTPITPQSLKIATRITYVIIFVIGIVGNAMVCYIIFKRHPGSKRRTIHNFTLNLALSDLLVLLIYLPSQVHLFETNMKWKLGEAMCRITYLIVPLSIYSSIGTLVAISRDRYYAVIHPMASLDRRHAKSPLICIWVTSFLFTIPLIAVSRIEQGYCTEAWPSQVLYHFYWIVAFCIQFAIPLSLLAVAHILIIHHLKRLKLPTEDYRRSRLQARRRQQQKMIIMSVALILAYMICMLPQHIIYFWMSFGDLRTQSYNMYIFQVANLMQILNSALNPVVYGTLNNDIKRGIISVFRRRSKASRSLPYWDKKAMDVQTMASFCTSPLLQRRISRQGSSTSQFYDNNDKWPKAKSKKHLKLERNMATSKKIRGKQYEVYSQDKDKDVLEMMEWKG